MCKRVNKVYFNSQRVQPKLGTTPNMKLASIFFKASEEYIRAETPLLTSTRQPTRRECLAIKFARALYLFKNNAIVFCKFGSLTYLRALLFFYPVKRFLTFLGEERTPYASLKHLFYEVFQEVRQNHQDSFCAHSNGHSVVPSG